MLMHAAMHWLRLEWQQRCLGWRRRAQLLGTLKTVLSAMLRHAAIALAAAGIAATMLGIAAAFGALSFGARPTAMLA